MAGERQVLFHTSALGQLREWMERNPATARKILSLIEAARRDPFAGIGQPEPLKHQLSGCWSRRIDQVHRLVYQVTDDHLIVLSCLWHYRET
jgi:toxin YoeB